MKYKRSLGWLNAIVLLTMVVAGCGDEGSRHVPTTINLGNFQAASVVIGQPNFTQGSANQGGAPGANTINAPFGNAAVGTLFVPDYGNNRVLGFNTVPTGNNASADFVLGQPDFTSTACGDLANEMCGPETIVRAGARLLVNEFDNNRVLIWNSEPGTTQAPADVVVGQSGFGSSSGACTSAKLNGSESIAVGGGKLIVSDSNNNRVMIWNAIPTANGVAADVVLGQNNFTTCVVNNDGSGGSAGPSAANFSYPAGAWTDGTQLFVADFFNSRVLVWNTFPTGNFQAADVVLGQNNFTCGAPNNDGTCGSGSPSANNLNLPNGVFQSGNRLIVSDEGNSRFLVYKGQ